MRARIAIAGWLILVAACASNDGAAPAVVRRDSAGITIVESRQPEWNDGSAWQIGDVVTQFEPVEVASVFGAVRLTDGSSVLGDDGGARVLFFAPDGSLRQSAGRAGDGPGEFRSPQFLGHFGDTVWVYDFNARLTRFDASGRVLDVANLTPPLPSGLAVGGQPDGAIVLVGQWGAVDRRVEGLVRDTVVVVRYRDGVRTDTLATTPGREFVQHVDGSGRGVMTAAILARRASAVTVGDAVALGSQVDRSFRIVDPSGRQLLVRWPGVDLTATTADANRWVDIQAAQVPADQREALRNLFSLAPPPLQRPAYGRFLSDVEDNVWVADFAFEDEEPASWNVFSSDGTWRGAVHAPDHFRLLEIGGDWVLGTMRDSLDVERLELRSLRRAR